MLTAIRNFPEYAEPVTVEELIVGEVYFTCQFLDDEMYFPVVEPLVFLGRNCSPADVDANYFQDAESYRKGLRMLENSSTDGILIIQDSNSLKYIFHFEKMVDQILLCSKRRNSSSNAV